MKDVGIRTFEGGVEPVESGVLKFGRIAQAVQSQGTNFLILIERETLWLTFCVNWWNEHCVYRY